MHFRYMGSGEDRVTEKMTAFGMWIHTATELSV